MLSKNFADAALVGAQNPILLGDYSEPQPDIALLRRQPDFYAAGHPAPSVILLLVEVSVTTVDQDCRWKVPLYARGGVQEVWLVDLDQENITIYRQPTPGGYRVVQVARRGEQIAPASFPQRPIATADILG